LQAELTQAALQRWVGAPRAFADDTLRYSLSGFDLSGLEQMLVQVNRTLKRNKAFDAGRLQGRIVAALDGVEVLSSYSRCCDHCLERRVSVKKAGVKVVQVQYYHRAVGCQVVRGPVKSFLALEWLQPGEGEDTAALRLLHRLPALYGSRFFDILLLDALYAQAPVLRAAAQHGRGFHEKASLCQRNFAFLLSQSGRVKTLAFQATASARAPQVTVEGWQSTGAARTPYSIFICMWCGSRSTDERR